MLDQVPIKHRLFDDYSGEVKSLGAWGGDFALVTVPTNGRAQSEAVSLAQRYFRQKGLGIFIPYSEMILAENRLEGGDGRFNSSQLEISWDDALVERPIMGEIIWQVPSNLPWLNIGAKRGSTPGDPSLSLTLRESVTVLEAQFVFDPQRDACDPTSEWTFEFSADPSNNVAFGKKTFRHLEAMANYYPFLTRTKLSLKSHNTFPHSAGIASSASASLSTALLAEGLATILRCENLESAITDPMSLQRASYLARLGSGSATRSAFPIGALWGEWKNSLSSSDEWGIGVADELPYLKTLEDMILVVDHNKKKISSRVGHELMDCHPYRQERYVRASARLHSLWPRHCRHAEKRPKRFFMAWVQLLGRRAP